MQTQRFTVGDVEILAMQDTTLRVRPSEMIPEYETAFMAEFAGTLDERGMVAMPVTSYLVRSDGMLYLVDSGLGGRHRPGFPVGRLDETMREAGVDPGDIERVIHTHLHIDHTGWNTVPGEDGQPRLFFPKARFMVQRIEWEYWMQPEHRNNPFHAHLNDCVAPLETFGRLFLIDGETAIDRNLSFIPTPGHTPGHVAIGIVSAGERAAIVGDLSHHPAHLIHPEWSPVFDTDRAVSAKSRTELLDRAATEEWTWCAGHWPFPGAGRVYRLDGKRHFRAL